MPETPEVVARNVRQQIEWYGEPLRDRIGRVRARLDVSQSALAGVLGLSKPMLSQLVAANRAKISNPAVLTRLLALEALVSAPDFDQLPAAAVKEKVAAIAAESLPTSTMISLARQDGPDPADAVEAVQRLMREFASAADIEAAADAIAADHPGIAEFLRVYGNGKLSDARADYRRRTGPT